MPIGVPRERGDPGRVPAFFMAVAIHAAFVVFLIFGVSWQTKAPPPLMAELWSSLPSIKQPEPDPEPPKAEPEPPPLPKVEVKTPPPPPQPTKADIELKEKLEKEKKQKLERERLEQEKLEKTKKAAEEKKRLEDDKKRKEEDKRKADEKAKKAAEAKAKAEADAALTARTAAQQKVVDEWKNRIVRLVQSKANVPDTVSGAPEVQIRLKLLVTGAVFEGVVVRRSGNRVYDDAIERAVAGIREWPTPSDPEVFRKYREIDLNIKLEK
jgi:colicin import membrane protein